MTFDLMCVHIIFSSVLVVFGHLWERAAHSVDLMLFSLTICNFSYFCFGFDGWVWVMIASVPGL